MSRYTAATTGRAHLAAADQWNWADDAACRGEDLALFFPPTREGADAGATRERKAKEICSQCPVRTECLEYAVSRPEKYGTWAGLNEDERASLRRSRMRRSQAGRAAA